MTKVLSCLLLLQAALLCPMQGAPISAADALANWTAEQNPVDLSYANSWTLNGSSIDYTTNNGSTLASDFVQTGNFTFTSRIQAYGVDNDRYGLVFGYTDPANNYRLSWEGGGQAEADGSRGLSLVREIAGTSVSLFNIDTDWVINVAYDVTVGRTGNDISVLVTRVSDSATIASTSVTDTTYLTGKVGIWTDSQTALFSNLDYTDSTAVPEPSTVVLAAAGLSCLLLSRRQNRCAR